MKQNIDVDLHYRWLWLFAGYALLGIIVYLSVTSEPVELDIDMPYLDKFSHALAYFILMAWFAQIYQQNKQRYLHAFAFILLGVALEVVQSFDPARMAEFADMVANAAGVLFAVLLMRYDRFQLLLKHVDMLLKNS